MLTRAQPVARARSSDWSSRIPPETSTLSRSWEVTSAMISELWPRPNAASRSTRWIHSAPASCQRCAAARGSPNRCSDPARPWTSCTAWPPATSTAGSRVSARGGVGRGHPTTLSGAILLGEFGHDQRVRGVDQVGDLVVGDGAVQGDGVPAVLRRCRPSWTPRRDSARSAGQRSPGPRISARSRSDFSPPPKAKILLPTLATMVTLPGLVRPRPGLGQAVGQPALRHAASLAYGPVPSARATDARRVKKATVADAKAVDGRLFR